MKKHLWVILSTVIVLAVLFSCVKPEGPVSITLDGDLEDWGSLLYEDSNNDCVWGNNELYKAGITFDSTNLYIAGVYKRTNNDFLCLVDLSTLGGATNTMNWDWHKHYTFSKGDIDIIFDSWDSGFGAFKVTSDTVTEITEEASVVVIKADDGTITVEAKIPLSTIGATNTESLKVNAAFAITGGYRDDIGKQFVGDFYPEQGYTLPSDGGITGPATITSFIKFPK